MSRVRGLAAVLRARVAVWLEGEDAAGALSAALRRGVAIESVRSLGPDRLEVTLGPAALRPLRHAVRGRARVRVRRRRGGVYLARAGLGRPGLILGGVGWAAALGVLGAMVWQVRVTGVAVPLGRRVAATAAALGVRPGAWRAAIGRERVARAVAAAVPALSWVGVGQDGGLVVVHAIARVRPTLAEGAGRLLVASHAGRVIEIRLRQGESLVRVGQSVGRGQALVQGYLGEGGTLRDGSPAPPRYVAPRAVVVARFSAEARASVVRRVVLAPARTELWTWIVSVPGRTLAQRRPPTGRVAERRVLIDWRIRLGRGEWCVVRVERVGVVRERVEMRTRAVARALALRQAERRLERVLGAGVRIVRRQTRVRWAGGRVWAHIAVEAEGDIARPRGTAPVGDG